MATPSIPASSPSPTNVQKGEVTGTADDKSHVAALDIVSKTPASTPQVPVEQHPIAPNTQPVTQDYETPQTDLNTIHGALNAVRQHRDSLDNAYKTIMIVYRASKAHRLRRSLKGILESLSHQVEEIEAQHDILDLSRMTCEEGKPVFRLGQVILYSWGFKLKDTKTKKSLLARPPLMFSPFLKDWLSKLPANPTSDEVEGKPITSIEVPKKVKRKRSTSPSEGGRRENPRMFGDDDGEV